MLTIHNLTRRAVNQHRDGEPILTDTATQQREILRRLLIAVIRVQPDAQPRNVHHLNAAELLRAWIHGWPATPHAVTISGSARRASSCRHSATIVSAGASPSTARTISTSSPANT